MRNRLVSITLVAWLAVVYAAASSAQTPVAQLKHRPFNERFQDEAPVSGRVVAGALISGIPAANGMNLLPPVSAAGSSVCVQVMSRDGRYWSENTFELPERIDTAAVDLEYPSRHGDYLNGLDFGELAILGTAGECATADKHTLFLASTKATGGEAPGIDVLVNSGRADTYIGVSSHPEQRRPRRCRRIEQGRRTGFDTICHIDVKTLTPAPERLEVRILRRRYERMLPPTEFTFLLPQLN